MNTTKKRDLFRSFIELIFIICFISTIGSLFVVFSVLLNKIELLILVYVLLLAALLHSFFSFEFRKKLEKVAVIGEGMKIFNRLERFYVEERPYSFFYYLLFPITGLLSFFFSKKRGRTELKAYFGLVQWIIVLLLIEGFSSYYRFYQHFELNFALLWLYAELLSVYFLCNFFAVPLATTSLRLGRDERRKQLFLTTFISLIVLTSVLFFFMRGGNYRGLLPLSIVMNQRSKVLKERYQHNWQKKKNDSWQRGDDFFAKLKNATLMYLRYRAEEIAKFNKRHYTDPNNYHHLRFAKSLNKLYQGHLQSISSFGEYKHLFITTNQEYRQLWGLILMPFRDSILYYFSWEAGKLKLYDKWQDIPLSTRKILPKLWDIRRYQSGLKKSYARLFIVKISSFLGFSKSKPYTYKRCTKGLKQRTFRIPFSPLQVNKHALFVIYHSSLGAFNYPKSIQSHLLLDHFATSLVWEKTWWTVFYYKISKFILWFFLLFMPFHIIAIFYSHFTIKNEELSDS